MVNFGEFTEEERQNFSEKIKKSENFDVKENEMEIWPEDDETMIKSYFGSKEEK